MAVTYQTSNSNRAGSDNTLALTKPSGTVDGDLLITCIAFRDNGSGMTTLSGWTSILQQASDGSGSFTKLALFYKIASSEGSSYTWTLGLTTVVTGCVIRVNGQNASGFIDASESGGNNGGGTSMTFGSTGLTPTKSESLLLQFWSAFNLSSNANSVSAEAIATSNPSWTEALDIDVNNGSFHQGLAVAYANRTATTATGASTATSGAFTNSYCGALLVIRRITDFSASIADTITETDNLTVQAGYHASITDSITETDLVDAEKSLLWNNEAKSATPTWNNENKS